MPKTSMKQDNAIKRKTKKEKDIEDSNKYKKEKAVTAMIHFEKFSFNMKKGKTDKSISVLKKKDLIVLWREWNARPLGPLVFDNDHVKSVNEVSHDTPIIENKFQPVRYRFGRFLHKLQLK